MFKFFQETSRKTRSSQSPTINCKYNALLTFGYVIFFCDFLRRAILQLFSMFFFYKLKTPPVKKGNTKTPIFCEDLGHATPDDGWFPKKFNDHGYDRSGNPATQTEEKCCDCIFFFFFLVSSHGKDVVFFNIPTFLFIFVYMIY